MFERREKPTVKTPPEDGGKANFRIDAGAKFSGRKRVNRLLLRESGQ